MSSIHTLQKLLESMRALRPVFSAAFQEFGGDSFGLASCALHGQDHDHHPAQDYGSCLDNITYNSQYRCVNAQPLLNDHHQGHGHEQPASIAPHEANSMYRNSFGHHNGHELHGNTLHHHFLQEPGNILAEGHAFVHSDVTHHNGALMHCQGHDRPVYGHAFADDQGNAQVYGLEHDQQHSSCFTTTTTASINMSDQKLDLQVSPATLDPLPQSMLLLLDTPCPSLGMSFDDRNLPSDQETILSFEPQDMFPLSGISSEEYMAQQPGNLTHESSQDPIPREAKPVMRKSKSEWMSTSRYSTESCGTQMMDSSAMTTPCKIKHHNQEMHDLIDDIEALGDEDDCTHSLDGIKALRSKNLVSERKGRKQLNEKLYTLRVLVPTISKMDKASIVSDAISHVQGLQKEVKKIQSEIHDLQSGREKTMEEHVSSAELEVEHGKAIACQDFPTHKILVLTVSAMEKYTYHVRVECKKGPEVSMPVTRAVDALDFDMVHANIATLGDNIIISTVVKASRNEALKPEELRERVLESLLAHGLQL